MTLKKIFHYIFMFFLSNLTWIAGIVILIIATVLGYLEVISDIIAWTGVAAGFIVLIVGLITKWIVSIVNSLHKREGDE